MIVTSYTSLVIESHRQSCTRVVSGLSWRLRGYSPKNETREPFRSYEPIAVRLTQPLASAGEVSEMAVAMQTKVRNAV